MAVDAKFFHGIRRGFIAALAALVDPIDLRSRYAVALTTYGPAHLLDTSSLLDGLEPLVGDEAAAVVYARANALKVAWNLHLASGPAAYNADLAHRTADVDYALASPNATTIGTLRTLLAEMQQSGSAHGDASNVHFTNDADLVALLMTTPPLGDMGHPDPATLAECAVDCNDFLAALVDHFAIYSA